MLNYIKKILEISKRFKFGKLEWKIRFEPAKLLGGRGFTIMEYPEAFKTNSDGAIIVPGICEHVEAMNTLAQLQVSSVPEVNKLNKEYE